MGVIWWREDSEGMMWLEKEYVVRLFIYWVDFLGGFLWEDGVNFDNYSYYIKWFIFFYILLFNILFGI